MEETESVKPFETCKMTVKEMDMAEHEIIKFVQMESFGEDIRLIKIKDIVSHSSSICIFDPLSVEDLLCVGGRLKNVPVEVRVAKNPIILLKHIMLWNSLSDTVMVSQVTLDRSMCYPWCNRSFGLSKDERQCAKC